MSDILSAKDVKIRKHHVCWGCGMNYPPGTRMKSVTVVDGKIATNYWCSTCQEYWNRHLDYDDEITFGELRREDPEEWWAIKDELEQDRRNFIRNWSDRKMNDDRIADIIADIKKRNEHRKTIKQKWRSSDSEKIKNNELVADVFTIKHLNDEVENDIDFLLNEIKRLQTDLVDSVENYLAMESLWFKEQKENENLCNERNKIIKGIKYLIREFEKIPVSSKTACAEDAYKKMIEILKEIGVKID